MYSRQFSQTHLFIPLLSVLVLLILSAIHVDAEGVLPSRQRHRAQALIAARRHYKRQFANDTLDATTSSDPSSSSASSVSSDSTTSPLSSLLSGLFNDTNSAATGTATGVLGPPVFVGGTTTDSGISNPFPINVRTYNFCPTDSFIYFCVCVDDFHRLWHHLE
jgi:hypothetical protein